MAKFTSAVVLAAGLGERFGGDEKKQFADVCGVPCIVRALRAFEDCPLVDEIVVVGEEKIIRPMAESYHISKIKCYCSGGDTRQQSALLGFDMISSKADFVAIHDAARCLVTPEIIENTIRAAYKYRAAAAAEKCVDTVKISDKDGFITDTADRDFMWLVKTPQVFNSDVYRASAYMGKKDGVSVTDDCMLVERLGFRVKLVECGSENVKLTVPGDLIRAEAIIMSREKKL